MAVEKTESMSVTTQKLPSEFVCPGCQTRLEIHSPITKTAADRGLHRGMLFACGHCGTFSKLGDSSLERLTVAEFKALPNETQRLLGITRMNIEKQNAKGGN